MSADKLKIAFYWAAGCGGCEVSVLDINEKILDVVAAADIVMWPVAMDAKYHDIRALPSKAIDVTFFNGAIRNDENAEMARLFRDRSRVLIAFGSCAAGGGIVGLGNLFTPEELIREAFVNTPSTENPEGIIPAAHCRFQENREGHHPTLEPWVRALDQVVTVDYTIPGCPPQACQVIEAVNALLENRLPPPGSVIGPARSLCEECDRKPAEGGFKKIPFLRDRLDAAPNDKDCLLEQGFICMGPATRAGCGACCPKANVPCTGCSGPAPDVVDQGAKMISALASILQTEGEDKKTMEEVEQALSPVSDPAGTFYRYYLARSILNRKRKDHA